MKLYGFVNFVEQHLVPYKYTSMGLVVIEASLYVVIIEGDFIVAMTMTDKLCYICT